MAEQSIDQLIEQYTPDDYESDDSGEDTSLESYLESKEDVFEWVIPPEQFVDFWVAAVFLLVGTWQIITMFFLLIG
ncbi:MAG: hypothetical protein FVQ81_09445 [Candidatus Glassbacteria bacterium]|nr:hypothetical protein [Candidatus Glassbacteria bacterium]